MRNKKRKHAFNLEHLEPRAFLDASALIVHGVLKITGTSGDDVIVVTMPTDSNPFPQVSINGESGLQSDGTTVQRIRINAGAGNDSVTIQSSNVQSFPTLILGGAGDDTLTGANESDRLIGGTGNDLLNGSAGDDILLGGEGDDTLVGGDGDDLLVGNSGNDTLLDSDQNNTLRPGGGGDRIYASSLHNTLKLSGRDKLTEPFEALDEAALRQRLTDYALEKWASRFGTTQPAYVEATASVAWRDPNPGPHAVTDGQYVYSLERVGPSLSYDLVITLGDSVPSGPPWDAWSYNYVPPQASTPPESVIARMHLEGEYPVIHLIGDRLAITSTTGSNNFYQPLFNDLADDDGLVIPAFGPNIRTTKLTLVDIHDPAQPDVLEVDTFQGTIANQTIDSGQLFLALSTPINLPAPPYHIVTSAEPPVDPLYSGTLGYDRQFETRENYIARLNATPLDQILPNVESVQYFDDYLLRTTRPMVTKNIVLPPFDLQPTSITTIAAFDLSQDHTPAGGPDASVSLLGDAAAYVTAGHDIYLAAQSRTQYPTPPGGYLFKFTPTGNTIAPVAAGEFANAINFIQSDSNRVVMIQAPTAADFTVSALEQDGTQFNVLGSKVFPLPGFGYVKKIALDGYFAVVTLTHTTDLLSTEFTLTFNIADPGNILLIAAP